jgi:ribonuclease/clavin/mitogillin
LAAKLNHLEEAKGEVLLLHKKGYSANEISRKLYPRKYPITYLSAYEFAPINIVKSILKDAL